MPADGASITILYPTSLHLHFLPAKWEFKKHDVTELEKQ